MSNKTNNATILPFLIAVYVTALVLRPILAIKIFTIISFTVPAGILIFPLSFICNDIFTEVYGYRKSKQIIRAGLLAQVLACLVIFLAVNLPGASFWQEQVAYEKVLGQNFRFAFASLAACYFGEIANSIILSKLKYNHSKVSDGQLKKRFVLSTIVGELLDSLIYILIGFTGILSMTIIFYLIISTWILKCLYEITFLPVSVAICLYIKRYEGLDIIDQPKSTCYSII
jgi:uncharacterized integral membrane protein (TIGR00697 family)